MNKARFTRTQDVFTCIYVYGYQSVEKIGIFNNVNDHSLCRDDIQSCMHRDSHHCMWVDSHHCMWVENEMLFSAEIPSKSNSVILLPNSFFESCEASFFMPAGRASEATYGAFVCFKQASEGGGEFLIADGAKILEDMDPEAKKQLHQRFFHKNDCSCWLIREYTFYSKH